MPERLFRAREVTVVDAVRRGEVHRAAQDGVQVLDRVVEQLDDVLAAVGVRRPDPSGRPGSCRQPCSRRGVQAAKRSPASSKKYGYEAAS